jgi:hypothetical protein
MGRDVPGLLIEESIDYIEVVVSVHLRPAEACRQSGKIVCTAPIKISLDDSKNSVSDV